MLQTVDHPAILPLRIFPLRWIPLHHRIAAVQIASQISAVRPARLVAANHPPVAVAPRIPRIVAALAVVALVPRGARDYSAHLRGRDFYPAARCKP